ncbi:hypothetical protein CSKR_109286 [Clonorchis sinensis]|uniref:Uncharacterized protein n=1 Tax=Clonorchis sinensis TaxID=79923 RepID=A0A3R7EYG2_CLOSI|nr:hypothetical protein CSKR_109286 [Clonorchis sinensis]
MTIRNGLLIRLLKTLRHPTTGFALLGAHQHAFTYTPTSVRLAYQRNAPNMRPQQLWPCTFKTFGPRYVVTAHFGFFKQVGRHTSYTTHEVAENSSTAHDRFRPSWSSSARSVAWKHHEREIQLGSRVHQAGSGSLLIKHWLGGIHSFSEQFRFLGDVPEHSWISRV